MITTKSSFVFPNYGLKTDTAEAVAAIPAPMALPHIARESSDLA